MSTPTPADKAVPNSFVALVPVPWNLDCSKLLYETHGQRWLEHTRYEVEPADDSRAYPATGTIRFEDGKTAQIIVEEPIPNLVSLAATSRIPCTPGEAMMLRDHVAIWRVSMQVEKDHALETAKRFARILNTFVEAGAPAVFLPFILELHSPAFLQSQSENLDKITNLVNLFVGAWDKDGWMMTRGLTVFGLPELETPVNEGLNAAYFRLMDCASGMLNQQSRFAPGSRLQIGPKAYIVEFGPIGPRDEQVPICGAFGVQSLTPA